jgi:hypothetical protein
MHTRPERRRHHRVEARLMVGFRMLGESVECYGLAQSSNVGGGGLLLPTTKAFAPGLLLSMRMRLPRTAQTLSLLGEVVSSKEIVGNLVYNTRIRFRDLDAESRDRLAELFAVAVVDPVPTGSGV